VLPSSSIQQEVDMALQRIMSSNQCLPTCIAAMYAAVLVTITWEQLI
jgi:hypothetical protein